MSQSPPPHCLAISLFGESFSYALEDLCDESAATINILLAGQCTPSQWIIAACQYRRTGRVYAAIDVLNALLEGSLAPVSRLNAPNASHEDAVKADYVESELHPIYMMLSSCESELAKRLSAKDSVESTLHARNAQEWLTRVYADPQPPRPIQSAVLSQPERQPAPSGARL